VLAVYYALGLSLLGLNFGLVIGLLIGLLAFILISAASSASRSRCCGAHGVPRLAYILYIVLLFVVGWTLESYVLTPKLVASAFISIPCG